MAGRQLGYPPLAGSSTASLSNAAANWTPTDRELLANVPYAQASIPEAYQRHVVDYYRKEVPGTIVVDTDNRYLYYVLPQGKAIRYGVTVGEEALAWSGIANIGRMEERPAWVPTRERSNSPGRFWLIDCPSIFPIRYRVSARPFSYWE